MGHITGENRYQTKIMCLDDYVDPKSTVRIIDRFIDGIDMKEYGFKRAVPNALGRNSYDPAYMSKLFVYGYGNTCRSSRKLEALTYVNIEVMWLMDEQKPDFKTIADFRKDNIAPLTRLLSEFNAYADYCGLFGKELVAIDGTKIKASNNKKNNFSKKKLQRNIEYNERRAREYLELLEESDDMDEACVINEKLGACEKRAEAAKELLAVLDKSGEGEISTVDSDARLMGNNRSGVDMAYNVQVAVDEKTHLVAEFDITQNPTDHGQLSNMTQKTQEFFMKKDMMMLADKGYYGGDDIEATDKLGATPVVARQLKPGEKEGSRFSLDKFVYDKDKDEYTCPMGKPLYAHSKKTTKDRKFFNKAACQDCPVREECLIKKDNDCPDKKKYRFIVRKPQSDALDRADERYKEHEEIYKLRQMIVEHPFGTVKRAMDGGYFLLRTKEKVKVEVALLFLGYNIKRTKNYLGFEKMMAMLEEWQAFLRQNALSFLLASLKICLVRNVLNTSTALA